MPDSGWRYPSTSSRRRSHNQLFRNLGDGRFVDITEQAGVGDIRYGMGGAAADYDDDGDVDLFVTNVGQNLLYENQGDGRFHEVGAPASFPPAQDFLYRTLGDGRFEDVTISSGIAGAAGPGLGVSVNDFDSDGHIDLFVANDGAPNYLWMNQGDGTFIDRAVRMGVAVNRIGMSEAGMGVTSTDVDHDGGIDLFMTHLHEETNTLYEKEGTYFSDATLAIGLAMASHPPTGFGVGIHDFNLDGRLDLFVANCRERKAQPPLYQDPHFLPNQIILGDSAGQWVEVQPEGGVSPPLVLISRAAAFADYDNNGDMDIAIVNNNGPFHLLRNTANVKDNWLLVYALDEHRHHATGARVWLACNDLVLWRSVQTAYSYQSANDPRAHFGLGDCASADEV